MSLDLWHQRLDSSRSLSKIFDLLYLPWLSYSSKSLPHYHITADNFVFNREVYPVKAELSQDQWQITFTDQNFQGYSQLILVPPPVVDFFQDVLALNLARQLGLITRDRWFIVASINNQPARVYHAFEAWNKDVLEKNRRSSDSDLFIPTDLNRLWQGIAFWKKVAVNPLAPQDYSALNQLLNSTPDQLARLVNLDSFARWQAYLKLNHRPLSEPFLLYFNRDLGQFEFIPDPQSNLVTDTRLISDLANLPQVTAQVDQLMADYLQDPQNRLSQLEYYRQLWHQTRFAFALDMTKPYSTLFFTVKAWSQRPRP